MSACILEAHRGVSTEYPENTLCALSGKTIRLEHPAILDKFASLARK